MADGIFARYAAQIPPAMVERARADIRKSAMQNLIDQRLLVAEAAKLGVTLSDAEKLEALSEMTGGVTNLETIALMQGISPEKFERMFSESVLATKVVNLQTNGIADPTPEEAKARFEKIVAEHPEAARMPEEVRAAHILVMAKKDSVTPEEDAAALAKINSIRERALAGEDFGALAKEFSEDPGSKDNGGEYTFGRGRMVPEFEKAAFEQEIGVVGEPVRTSYGYHILKVSKRTIGHDVTFEEVEKTIVEGLRREAVMEKIQAYVKSLRDAATIEIVEKAVVSEPIAIPVPAPAPEAPAEPAPEAPAEAAPEAPAAE
jgi:parvulin-like peptidyl-prolyl isomerase